MKRMLMTTTVTLCVLLIASFQNKVSAQPRTDVSISYQTFYDELDPYGRWMDYPDYGYVWIPDAGPDFRPYGSSGHWVWSDDYEWMWVSDYNWGWAPFHYGRWLQDPYYGWIWVPGYEWSPAWVAWRDGGDYYGWAPLRPGINISIGFNLGGYNPPVDYWCFSPRRYITHRNVYNYCAPRQNNVTIINQTTIINNYNYNRNVFRTGPGRRDAERYTGRINSVRFRDAARPGRTSIRNNEVSIYRPSIQRDNNRSIAPRRFEQFDRSRSNGNNNGNRGNVIRRSENGNNLPQRREDRVINRDRPINRNEGQRRNENGIAERPRMFRDQNNEAQGNNNTRRQRMLERPERNNNDNRVERNEAPRRSERSDINTRPRMFERQQQNNNQNNNGGERRMLERRQMGGNENRPQRQSQPQMEQRRQEQPRMEQRRQEQPRMEQRRQEQPRQEQPRQFEQRRTESRNESRSGGGNGNSGGGKSWGGFGKRDR